MIPLSSDTSVAAPTLRVEAWRRLAPAEKLAMVGALTAAVLRLERAGLRSREPTLDATTFARRLAERRI